MYEDKPPFHWQDRADRTVVLHCRKILPNDRGDKGFQLFIGSVFLLAEIIEYTASGTATACDSG